MSAPSALERDTRGLAVEFEHVHHSFLHGDRPVRVLEDFNLRIEPSEFVRRTWIREWLWPAMTTSTAELIWRVSFMISPT